MTPDTEPSFLTIGQITKPHGLRGDVIVKVLTELPERFEWLEQVYLGHDDDEPRPVAVESVRFHQDRVLLKLTGYDGRDAADALRGQWVQVPLSEALPLEEGEVYLYQLQGLAVYTDEDEYLGQIKEVMLTNANNVIVVEGPRGEILLPDTDEVVQSIDLDDGRMTVHILPGLLG